MIKTEPRKGGFKVFGSGGGGKSGGSSRTPVETPDSLHNISYAAILDVISNGEVYGPAHPSQPLRDIYLDGTPIQNEDGSLNFQSVESDYRVGTIDQEHIAGFPASVSVISVGTEITTSTPWTQQINGSELSAVRVSINVPQLLKTYDSGDNAGDRVGYKVEYAIDISSGGGAFENVITTSFNGKTVNGYTRTHRIELPSGNSFWTVRVRRITAESTSTTIQDAIYLDSYAEVIDGKFRHPMTALIGVKIDAEQFQSIPTRAYHWKGRIIRVPSNYDPETRTYSGVWDGTFKSAYSNNPAWVFYDMLTNTLFGLGEYIKAASVDRYALYQIGAYCDQMVDDGQGGLEPRFVCNCYIQSGQDALRVLNDLSSIFRGMAYWSDGQVVPVADMPSDPVYNYTNANVIDGKFEYAGSDLKTRKTVALVSWNDPSNFYKSKVEVVEDSDGIARYGIRKTEVIAFGCTSRGQAQRIGLYLLYTSRMETGTVAFSVGLDGIIPQPGSIIKIADRNRAGRQIGGRISQSGTNFIITDREHPAKIGDTINVNLPSGANESRLVYGIDGRKITVDSDFSSEPSKQSVWSIDADDLVTQQARVISVSESDGIQYDVNCVFHHPGKFAAIDNGVRLDPLPVSVVPPRTQNAPTNIQIAQFNTFKQGTTRQNAEITWDAPEYAVQYDVQWKRDNGDWVSVTRTGTRTIQLSDIFAGEYIVRVRAINSLDVPSLWAYSSATQLDGIVGAPPAVTTLSATGQVMAITLEWSYPYTANIISQIEIRASLNNDFSASYPLTFAAYPATTFTVNGLGNGTEMWVWARLIDKNGLAGEWAPLSTDAGAYGKSSVNADEILSYLEGQIGAGELAPGLIEQIGEDISAGIIIDVDNKLAVINQTISDLETVVNQKIDTTNQTVADLELDVNQKIDATNQTISDLETVVNQKIDTTNQTVADLELDVNQKISATNQTVADLESDVNQKIDATNQTVADLELDVNQKIDSVEVDFDGKIDGINQSLIGHLAGDDENASEDVLWYAGDDGEQDSFVGSVSTTSAYNSEDYARAKQISVLAGRVGDNQAYIAHVESASVSMGEAIAQTMSELSVSVGENSALIASEEFARAAADESLSRSITALNAEVGSNSAKILNEQTARVNADGALSQEITALTAEVGDNAAAIIAEQTARANADGALSQEITALKAEVDDNAAAITSEASARASEDSALSTRIDTLTAEVGDSSAAILAEQTARVNADGALSQEIAALTAEVGDNAAAILAEQTARANEDSALASSINALKAEVDDNSAAIVTESEVRAGAVSELDGRITDDAIKSFGYLAGDDEQTEDLFQWYAGDDDQQESNVGNVSATSASNEQDYSLARQLTVVQVKSEENAAAITSEQLARVSANEALASDISSLSAEVGENKALILSEQLARSTSDESLARTIQALNSKVGDTEAKLTLEQTTRAAEDDALSQQILTLTAEVGDNSAAILAEQTARVNADGALSQEITALTAEVGDNAAAILAEQTARANEDSALASSISALQAEVDNNAAAITSEASARASEDSALSTRIDTLTAEVGDNSAAILAEQTARVNADGALSQEITALTAEVGDNAAAILAEQTARTDGDSALASSINALQAEVDDNSAAIMTESEVRAGAVSELDGKLTDDAIKSFGYLAGDDEQTEDLFQWYAGDDEQQASSVGNVSATSASNEQDYTLARQLTVIRVKSEENAAAITSEQLARVSTNEALASDINSLSAEVGDNKALILSEQLARSTADESLARTIQALGSKVGDTEAKLTLEQTTRAAEDGALSQQILTLTATVGDNSAAILAEQTARVNADGALSQEITALTAEVGDNAAAILAEQTARANEDSALANSINALQAEVDDNAAAITSEASARASEDSALSTRIDTLTAEVGDNSAAILAEQTARVNADGALSQEITALTAEVGDNAAAILAEQAARANEDSALAQDIQTLSAQVGDAEAAIQKTSQAVASLDGSLKANWQVKTEVRQDGKVVQAGVGLGASIGEDGTSRSEFLVMADTIGFLNSIDGQVHSPFVFDTVNDTAFLNAAIIGDATISFAKIQNDIQSENYIAGEAGWKINKNGGVEFSNGQFRGTVYAERIVGDVANVEFISTTSLITRQTNKGQTLYTQIGEFYIAPAAFERSLIVPGGIRFDDPGGGGAAVWVEVLINDVVAYTMGGSNENSFIDSGYYYSTPGKVSLPAGQDINVKMRLKSFLNSSSPSAWFYAYYRPQGVTFLYIKA